MRRTSRAVGFAARARCVLERLPLGGAQVRHRLHPGPALGVHRFGQRLQLLAHQPFQQRGIGQGGSGVLVVGEQVAANATPGGGVGIQADEVHQGMVGADFPLSQALAQRCRAALPFGCFIERGLLGDVVVGHSQRHQLV
jgi:hypothetical protein